MQSIRVGIVADPAAPTDIARGLTDLSPPDGSEAWDITVVSEPFTTGSEDVETAVARLQEPGPSSKLGPRCRPDRASTP